MDPPPPPDPAPRIRHLPAATAHQLRSAVVLFQPSQAVHELVANAIDAGATHLDVVVDFERLIFTVSDNGHGMSKEDLQHIGQRHVTSKCSGLADLSGASSARSLGWRGEALSSLSQLGVLEIQTRARDPSAPETHQREGRGGKRRKVDALEELTRNAFGRATAEEASAAAASTPATPASSSSPSTSSSSLSLNSSTYSKLIRHGITTFFGFSPAHRLTPGSTLTLSSLYSHMPVRLRGLQEDKERLKTRESIKRAVARIMLIHPQVQMALYDAGIENKHVQGNTAPVASKHYFPDAHTRTRSSSSFAPTLSTHLPIHPSQRIWLKPKASSLIDNFASIFGGGGSSPSSGSGAGIFSLEHTDLIRSLVELRRFHPSTPLQTTPATTAFLSNMHVSGFLSHPGHQGVLHKDYQFLFVNQHFVSYRRIHKMVDDMYERLGRIIPTTAGGMGTGEGGGGGGGEKNRGGGSIALQRGSIKQKGGSSGVQPSPSKQGRRRYPSYLLHLSLPAHHYDLMFTPDKTSIEFDQKWAVVEGVTQALRKWLWGLYPTLSIFDKQIFPPTYMPQWLNKREGEEDEEDTEGQVLEGDQMKASPSSASTPTLAPNSWAAHMSSDPSAPIHLLRSTPVTQPPHEPVLEAPNRSSSHFSHTAAAASSSSRSVASFTQLQEKAAHGSLASEVARTEKTTVATPNPILSRIALYKTHSHTSAVPSAPSRPSFHSSYAHSTSKSRPSRTPSAFLGHSSTSSSVSHPHGHPVAFSSSSLRPSSRSSSFKKASHTSLSAAHPMSPHVDVMSKLLATSMLSAYDRLQLNYKPEGFEEEEAEAEEEEEENVQDSARGQPDQSPHDTSRNFSAHSSPTRTSLKAHPPSKLIRESEPSKERETSKQQVEDSTLGWVDSTGLADLVGPPPTEPGLDDPEREAAESFHTPTRRSVHSFTQAAAPPVPDLPEHAVASIAEPPLELDSDQHHPHTPAPSSFQKTVEKDKKGDPQKETESTQRSLHFDSHEAHPHQQSSLQPPAAAGACSRSPSPSPPPLLPISSSWLPHHSPTAPSASSSLQFRPIQLNRSSLTRFQLIGQLDRKFLMVRVEDEGLLVAVDQHAADERRRVEFLQRHLDKYVQGLPLVQPLALTISSAEAGVLHSHEGEINAWGFRYRFANELSGGHHQKKKGGSAGRIPPSVGARLLLQSVPLICGVELDIDDLREYLQQLRDTKPIKSPPSSCPSSSPLSHYRQRTPLPVQRILNYKACRSSVMFGDPLPVSVMCAILKGLAQCDFPYNCAHGRPTMTPIVQVQPLESKQQKEGEQEQAGEKEAEWTAEQRAELHTILSHAR